MNFKFAGFIFSKITIIKSTFLRGLQSLKQIRNPTSTKKQKQKYVITKKTRIKYENSMK